MQWHNEPPKWRSQDGRIEVSVTGGTDFWRKTHYGFIRDNGHFGYIEVEGDFTAEVKVNGHAAHRQADGSFAHHTSVPSGTGEIRVESTRGQEQKTGLRRFRVLTGQ